MDRIVSSAIVPVLAGVFGGVIGGLIVTYARPAPPPARASTVAASSLAGDVDDLASRVELLEKQVSRLHQVRAPAPIQIPVAAAGEPSAEGAAPGKVVDDPVFEAAVRDIVDRVQQERSADRLTHMEERRQQAVGQWADRFGQQLQLSEEQKAKVLAIAQDYVQKLRDLHDSDAGPTTREEWRSQRNALRDQSEQSLSGVLTPSQMQSYKASEDLRIDAAMRGGWGGGRGRPPRGD